jgi:hypothetical protein
MLLFCGVCFFMTFVVVDVGMKRFAAVPSTYENFRACLGDWFGVSQR